MKELTSSFHEALNKKVLEFQKNNKVDDSDELPDNLIKELIESFSDSLKSSLLKDSPSMLEEHRKFHHDFCERNYSRWSDAFDLFETLLVICKEVGEDFNISYRPKAIKDNNLVFDLLVRLHARSCLVSQEILCLLKSGFPDGANARWRTLHEIAATALFMKKHGQECAERFYWHEWIESYKGMVQHEHYEERLNEQPPSVEEIEHCRVIRDELLVKYGQEFKKTNAWASPFLPNNANISEIEKDVSLDHMRPYYKLASQNIHSGAKGLKAEFGISETSEDILLVGQSNSGMVVPAHATAISISQLTTALLSVDSTVDNVIMMKIIKAISDNVGDSFLKTMRVTTKYK